MKIHSLHILPMATLALLPLAGCLSIPEEGPPPATQADVTYLREELRRLNDRIQSSESELGNIQRDVAGTRSTQTAYATAAQLQALQEQIATLQTQLRAVDAARAQDKKDIYDDITKKVANLMKTAAPARPAARAKSQTGIEHVVQSGESLSKIAAAYGVKMSVLVTENGLKSADNIFVGQKLFIPD